MINRCSAVIFALMLPVLASTAHAQEEGVREVTMGDRSLVPLSTRLRFFTEVFFPEGDSIKDANCGDPTFWVVEWLDNVLRVKPAKKGASTNLSVLMASGRSYMFKLSEGISAPIDHKVFVVSESQGSPSTIRYVPVAEVDALRAQLVESHAALDRAKREAEEGIAAVREELPTRLHFDFRVPPHASPFGVRAIWHDGVFTYIRSDARELPALYELVDGQPSLLNYSVKPGGTYVIAKVLDRAYLVLGKKRLTFERR